MIREIVFICFAWSFDQVFGSKETIILKRKTFTVQIYHIYSFLPSRFSISFRYFSR